MSLQKRMLCCAVCLAVSGCAPRGTANPSAEEETELFSLLQDQEYSQGFLVTGLVSHSGNVIEGAIDYGLRGLQPAWRVAQWSGSQNFTDEQVTKSAALSQDVWNVENAQRKFQIDRANNRLTFGVNASQYYAVPRKAGEAWLHLLIEQSLGDQDAERYKVDTMQALRVTMQARLTRFEDRMQGQADASYHAAQFQLFLYLRNKNRESKGYGDMVWFGIPLFDNRAERTALYAAEDGGHESSSHLFIYTIAGDELYSEENNFWKAGQIHAGEAVPWVHVDVDVLPHIMKAFALAHERGYMRESSMEDLYIGGLNLGWEVPGTYDVEMQVQGFDLLRD